MKDGNLKSYGNKSSKKPIVQWSKYNLPLARNQLYNDQNIKIGINNIIYSWMANLFPKLSVCLPI